MTDPTAAPLEPCPFCGADVVLSVNVVDDGGNPGRPTREYFISCCATVSEQSLNWFQDRMPPENDDDFAARDRAVATWNRRAVPEPASMRGEVVLRFDSLDALAHALRGPGVVPWDQYVAEWPEHHVQEWRDRAQAMVVEYPALAASAPAVSEAVAWVNPSALKRLVDKGDIQDSIHAWAAPPSDEFVPLYAAPRSPQPGREPPTDQIEMVADLIEKYTYVMSKHNPDLARVAGHNSCATEIIKALSALQATAGTGMGGEERSCQRCGGDCSAVPGMMFCPMDGAQ